MMDSDLTDVQLQLALSRAVADARLLAFVFILTGALGCWIGFAFGRGFNGRFFGGACAAMLLAPGVLYYLAGRQIRARQSAGGRLGLWAAVSHLAAIPATFILITLIHQRELEPMMAPAGVSIFFTPALIAFLFSMRRAQRIARLLGEPGQGFAVLPPQAVLPVESAENREPRE